MVRGRSVERDHLAAVNARTGALLPWSPDTDGQVKTLTVNGSSVYVAGSFSEIDGQSRDGLAAVDTSSGRVSRGFRHRFDGRVNSVVATGDRLYVGGAFTEVDDQDRGRLAAFNLRTGTLDSRWRPDADDQVDALAAGPGRIYVGGAFHEVGGVSGYDRLAALDTSGGAVVPGFKPGPEVVVFGLAVSGDSVYAAQGGQGGMVSAYSAATGLRRWAATFDGDAQAVAMLGGSVYAGGHFDKACRTARTGARGACLDGSDARIKLAALDPDDGHLLDWTADANGVEGVLALAASPSVGAIAAGGAFTTIGGREQKRLAQLS
jgi:outer membrane protein assembly factor BamB